MSILFLEVFQSQSKKIKINPVRKKYLFNSLVLIFLVFSVVLALALVSQKTVFKQRAAQPLDFIIQAVPQTKLNRIWNNFAQGGEETKAMLQPVEAQIRKLQPQYIRIDHLFDFPDLDRRVDEIIKLGATPFLALSYFPASVSTNLTDFPPSLDAWTELVKTTIQKYSGKKEKNIYGIYYEVWNEPDLFGQMNAEQYFRLYSSAVQAASECKDCNSFKIGGPAITTLKKDWMNNFLTLVNQNSTRLDFLSWHSYQTNPQKTFWESQQIQELPQFLILSQTPELNVTEWGSTPENSQMHDSFFDASHTINAVGLLKNSGISKLFAFELKDGPDPAGKSHWGRWGMLTYQGTPKPRYYAFLYLDKLLEYELAPIQETDNISVINSGNGKTNYSFVLSNNKSLIQPMTLIITQIPPGTYILNKYLYDQSSLPEKPQTTQLIISSMELTLNENLNPNAISLYELSRISAVIDKYPGRSGETNDFTAKSGFGTPALVYPINPLQDMSTGKINIWFKPSWVENDPNKQVILESHYSQNEGFNCYIKPDTNTFYCQINNDQELKLPVNFTFGQWYQITVLFDNSRKIFSARVNDEQNTLPLSKDVRPGNFLYIGSSQNQKNVTEGFIDDLEISINDKLLYQETFN